MNFETLKGTKDSVPKEEILRNKVLDVIRSAFESYGFRPFDTPLIEYLDTLANKYDDDAEIVQEIFKVTDRGERALGLRYDLTIPLCRFIAQNIKALKLPFRRYAVGKVFRDGPLKKGRMREFMQCDGDVVGVQGRAIEAELLTMFYETYRALEIDAILEINNNKILRGAFVQQGFKEEDLESLILSVDKLKKIKEAGVLKETSAKGFAEAKVKGAISILSSTSFDDIRKQTTDDLLKEGIDELAQLVELLDEQGVNYRVNFSMSRGLNYYTGNIWEAYDVGERVTSSIGSGGRYDKGIGNYIDDGNEYPALGVSFGLVPIMELLAKEEKEGLTDVLVAPLSEEVTKEAFKVARTLREEGLNAEMYYGYKMKKVFSYAEYLGVSKLAIIGKKDVEEGVFTLKDLESGEEEKRKL